MIKSERTNIPLYNGNMKIHVVGVSNSTNILLPQSSLIVETDKTCFLIGSGYGTTSYFSKHKNLVDKGISYILSLSHYDSDEYNLEQKWLTNLIKEKYLDDYEEADEDFYKSISVITANLYTGVSIYTTATVYHIFPNFYISKLPYISNMVNKYIIGAYDCSINYNMKTPSKMTMQVYETVYDKDILKETMFIGHANSYGENNKYEKYCLKEGDVL